MGRGSFGEVYRAFDPRLQRHVALKLLLPSRLTRDEEVSALLREARAIARVRHPNIVQIYGVDRHDGRLGFWSDFVQGQTLAELVTTQGSMGPREAAFDRRRRVPRGRRRARRGIPPSRHQGRQRDARGGRADPADGLRTHPRTRPRRRCERHARLHGAGAAARTAGRRSRARSTPSASCCSIC